MIKKTHFELLALMLIDLTPLVCVAGGYRNAEHTINLRVTGMIDIFQLAYCVVATVQSVERSTEILSLYTLTTEQT